MLTGTLFPYQEPIVDAALARGKYLIAADMGLGKTICAISVAEELLGCGDIGLCVIVCPANLRYQWAKALAKFTDLPRREIKVGRENITVPESPYCIVVDGKEFQKNLVKYSAADDRRRQFAAVNDDTDYVIMSYETAVEEHRQVRKLRPGMAIIDEITNCKTFRSRRSKVLKKVLNPEYRIGLTGTPIENGKPEELFSLMQLIDDTVLGRWDLFDKTYIDRDDDTGLVSGWKNLNVLRERLTPAMARLSRDEPGVREYMPEPVHDEWVVPFISGRVRDAYMAMGRDLYAELGKISRWGGGFDVADYYGGRADESTKVGKIMAVHTAMEQLLDHPDLVVESGMNYEATQNLPLNKRKGSRYAYRVWQEGLLDDVWDSVKLPYLKREAGNLISEGRKVLIFSKFRPMLQYIEDYLGVPCVQYHGQMSASQKAAAVESFTREDGPQVFLSSHAGAYGMDMYMATDLINFDNTNIAGRADQVNARHVRASSEFAEVYIHSMIVSGTIEERIMAMQSMKRRVGSAVTDGRGADRFGRVANDVESLTSHLEGTIEGL